MRAAVHVIPCAGVLKAAGEVGLNAGSGIARAGLQTAERLEEPADLVLLAVPAGAGAGIAAKLEASARPVKRKPPARYIAERGAEFDELGDVIVAGPEPRR